MLWLRIKLDKNNRFRLNVCNKMFFNFYFYYYSLHFLSYVNGVPIWSSFKFPCDHVKRLCYKYNFSLLLVNIFYTNYETRTKTFFVHFCKISFLSWIKVPIKPFLTALSRSTLFRWKSFQPPYITITTWHFSSWINSVSKMTSSG